MRNVADPVVLDVLPSGSQNVPATSHVPTREASHLCSSPGAASSAIRRTRSASSLGSLGSSVKATDAIHPEIPATARAATNPRARIVVLRLPGGVPRAHPAREPRRDRGWYRALG